jgi:hypothetical protein
MVDLVDRDSSDRAPVRVQQSLLLRSLTRLNDRETARGERPADDREAGLL